MRSTTCCRRCAGGASAAAGCLAVVFGAGGDRDPSKRPLMGAIAARLADRVVVTSDNPRSEDPLAIIGDIGKASRRRTRSKPTARAPSTAIDESRPADVVLIAGKGHETYQEIAGRRMHFSDAGAARAPRLRGGADDAARRGRRRARRPHERRRRALHRRVDRQPQLRAGDLFVALRGERFDGHDFLKAAAAASAAAAMVDAAYRGEYPLPALVVGDTRRSLGDLARYWRARFAPALIAITGSNGKTTVKEMLAGDPAAPRRRSGGARHARQPQQRHRAAAHAARLRHAHRWCAIELGMNHKGEIAYLAGIARPTVALVNNAQREHLEFMRSVEEVAAENARVYDALPADGVAVINADDPHAAFFRSRAGKRRSVEFGLGGAPVGGRYRLQHLSSEIRLQTPAGEADATLAIPGMHNVRNALAAAACAHAVGINPSRLAKD